MPDQAPAMKGVIPYLNVDGASEVSAFYQRAFGAKELMRMPAEDGKRLLHCRLEINDGVLMMSDTFTEHGPPFQPSESFTMQLVVDDIDAWWKRDIDAGCTAVAAPQVMFWGDKYGQLTDPFGIHWAMNQPGQP